MEKRKIKKGIMHKKMNYEDYEYFTNLEKKMKLTSVQFFSKLRPWVEKKIEEWKQSKKSIS